MVLSIDLNCDIGEGFGVYSLGNDETLIPLISSANIACGFHAGDPHTMRQAVEQCLAYGVEIGAHPGLPDRLGFGRRRMDMSWQEVYDQVLYQIGALSVFVEARGEKLHHVKPHGALYNMAAKDQQLANAIAQAVYDLDSGLILYGLSGSCLIEEAKLIGLRTAQEAFIDRTYQSDGTLTSRDHENSVIFSSQLACEQALSLILENKVTTLQREEIHIQSDTLCIHGDNKNALPLLQALLQQLEQHHIQVSSL